MTNYLVVFWQWLNPFKGRKPLDKKKEIVLMKAVIIGALMIPIIGYYIKCNEVVVLFTNIASSDQYGNIPLDAEIGVCYDFNNVSDFKTKDIDPGVSIEFSMPNYDSLVNSEPVFSKKNIEKLIRHKNSGPFSSFYPYADEILLLNERLKANYSESSADWDSIRGIYKVVMDNKSIFPFKPFIDDGTKYRFDLDAFRKGGYVSSSTLLMPLIRCNDTIRTNMYYLTDGHKIASHTVKLGGTSFKYYSNIFLEARDITNSVVTFKLSGPLNVTKLLFYFMGATEFSQIYPAPDVIDVNSIIYNEPEKLDIILNQGLTFHANFPDMESKQQAKIFAITTLLTLLITLFLKYIYELTVDFGRKFYNNHRKLLYIIYAIIILILILYYPMSVYFPIIY